MFAFYHRALEIALHLYGFIRKSDLTLLGFALLGLAVAVGNWFVVFYLFPSLHVFVTLVGLAWTITGIWCALQTKR